MDNISSEKNKKFWQKQSVYKGAVISKTIVKISKKYIGNIILDAGAGDGSLFVYLKKKFKNKQIIGVDLAPKNNKNLKDKILKNCYNLYLNKLRPEIIVKDLIKIL